MQRAPIEARVAQHQRVDWSGADERGVDGRVDQLQLPVDRFDERDDGVPARGVATREHWARYHIRHRHGHDDVR